MSVPLRRLREAFAGPLLEEKDLKIQELQGQLETTSAFMRESLAELELFLEDRDWQKLTAGGDREFSHTARKTINRLARLYWTKNPLVRRAVLTQTQYVFGQGMTVQARHPEVQDVVQRFVDDLKNQASLTSHQARMTKETELQVFGEIFFVLFPHPKTGNVRVRTIPPDEIAEIVTNPDDRQEPWFYRRVWAERQLDLETGRPETRQQAAYYPDLRYQPPRARRRPAIGKDPVHWDMPVYHLAVNRLSDQQRGVSEIYAAIDWAKAYKEFLEDWATLVKAYSRIAWQATVKGGPKAVQSFLDFFQTSLGRSGAAGVESNPAPAAASIFASSDSVSLQAMRTSGATTRAEDGRRLLLMVSAATGVFEHYMGDPSTGNLATAKSMERPMELMFRDRQQLWADTFVDLLQFVIDQAVTCQQPSLAGRVEVNEYGEEYVVLGGGKKDEEIDRTVDVAFPDILEKDVGARVEAIVAAATLKGFQPAGTIEQRELVRLLLTALGLDDVDEALDRMFPDQGAAANMQQAVQAAAQAAAGADEAVMRAAETLTEAVNRLVASP